MRTKTLKKIITLILSVLLIFGLTACGNEKQTSDRGKANSSLETEKQNGTDDIEGGHILIAYFSVPEDVDTSGVDAVAGASIVVRDNEVCGNTEYVAKIIQETTGADLFRIDQAADEQDENARPELKNHIEDMGQYDTIILGYPNWWADLPMPVYTFLEEYDFSGKIIIPFVTHGGSGFSDTRDTISELEPDAAVSDNTLSISRGDVAGSEEEIRQWAETLR